MSLSVYANAVIGVEVDPYKILPNRKIRKCECRVKVTEDMKYCPSCGHKAWRNAEDPIEGFVYDKNTDSYTLFGFPVLKIEGYDPTDSDHYRTLQMFVTAARICHGDVCYDPTPEMVELPENLSEMKESLKSVLEPKGFWDESKFGLWAIGELH